MKRTGGTALKDRFGSAVLELSPLPRHDKGLVLVSMAIQTGMRIGEILALRWKRVDLLNGTLEVAETYSEREFGSPKRGVAAGSFRSARFCEPNLKRSARGSAMPVRTSWSFKTPRGTPLDAKNLYNRALAPACDRIEKPRISWHSFRHAHATLLGDVGGSRKTAQALLGPSDLETTFNTYTHAIPDSQRPQ